MSLVPKEARIGYWVPWNLGYRQLQATVYMPGTLQEQQVLLSANLSVQLTSENHFLRLVYIVFVCAQLPCSLEEGPDSLEAGVIGRCEVPVWVLGTKGTLSAGTANADPTSHL